MRKITYKKARESGEIEREICVYERQNVFVCGDGIFLCERKASNNIDNDIYMGGGSI